MRILSADLALLFTNEKKTIKYLNSNVNLQFCEANLLSSCRLHRSIRKITPTKEKNETKRSYELYVYFTPLHIENAQWCKRAFRTSCLSYKTKDICKNLYLPDKKGEDRKIHSILTYQS